MKSLILALNAAAVSGSVTFLGTELDEVVYDTVHAQKTYDDKGWSLTANWGSAELKKGDDSAFVLAVGYEIALDGANDAAIADGANMRTWFSVADPANAGKYETWYCQAAFKSMARPKDDDGEVNNGAVTVTSIDIDGFTPTYSVSNLYADAPDYANAIADGPWFGDATDPKVSYASVIEYPEVLSAEAIEKGSEQANAKYR